MLLLLDFGNTSVKIAIYNKELITLSPKTYPELTLNELLNIINTYSISQFIYTSVVEHSNTIIDELSKVITLIKWTKTKLPILNLYQTPLTLGEDRIVACIGANSLKPNSTSLIIDAGTCIKYDLILNGTYLGGAIAPGIEMQLKALNYYTSKLPLIPILKKLDTPLVGRNTEKSILSGVINGTIAQLNNTIAQYKQLYTIDTIFLIGGNANLLQNKIKYTTFAHSSLIFRGLLSIYNYYNAN
jgi:type III pantothenate kinase